MLPPLLLTVPMATMLLANPRFCWFAVYHHISGIMFKR